MADGISVQQHSFWPTLEAMPLDWADNGTGTVVVPNRLWQQAVLHRYPQAKVQVWSQWLAESWPSGFPNEPAMPTWAPAWQCQWAGLQSVETVALHGDLTDEQHRLLHALQSPEAIRGWLLAWEQWYLQGGAEAPHKAMAAIEQKAGLSQAQQAVLAQVAETYQQYWQPPGKEGTHQATVLPRAMVLRQWIHDTSVVRHGPTTAWVGFSEALDPVAYWFAQAVAAPSHNNECVNKADSASVHARFTQAHLTVSAQCYATQAQELDAVVAAVTAAAQATESRFLAIAVPPTTAGLAYGRRLTEQLQRCGVDLHPESLNGVHDVYGQMPGMDTLQWGLMLLQAMLSGQKPEHNAGDNMGSLAIEVLPEWAVRVFPQHATALAYLSDSDWESCWQLWCQPNLSNNAETLANTALLARLGDTPPETQLAMEAIHRCLLQWQRTLGSSQFETWFSQWWQFSGAPQEWEKQAKAMVSVVWQHHSTSAYQAISGLQLALEPLLVQLIRQQTSGLHRLSETGVAVLSWPEAAGLPWQSLWLVGLTEAMCQSASGFNALPTVVSGSQQVQACVQGASQVQASWFQQRTFTDGWPADSLTEQRPWAGPFELYGSPACSANLSEAKRKVFPKPPAETPSLPVRQHFWHTLPQQPSTSVWASHDPVPLSATGIASYMRCPRQFLYRQWLQLPSQGSAAMVYGRMLHRLLELFHCCLALTNPPQYNRNGVDWVWQQWKTLSQQAPAAALVNPLPEPFVVQDVLTLQQLPALVLQELNDLIGQTLHAMESSGYFAEAPAAVVPEVSVNFKQPHWPKVEWIGKIDALLGYARTGEPQLQWDVMDFKHDNLAKWREKTAKSREGKLVKALAPLPETSTAATHAERFADADNRNYQIPLYFAATQWDEVLKTQLAKAEQMRTGNENDTDTPPLPWIGRVGLQIIRAPIGDADTTGAAKISCLQVALSADMLSSAITPCLQEVYETVAVPLSECSTLECNVGSHCRQCDYRMVCPEGLASPVGDEADGEGSWE